MFMFPHFSQQNIISIQQEFTKGTIYWRVWSLHLIGESLDWSLRSREITSIVPV